MDRRMFLGGVGACLLAPAGLLQPKWNKPPIDVQWVDYLGKWVPKKWYQNATIIACSMMYNLEDKLLDLKEEVVNVHLCYDHVMWRSMMHGWIAWVEINPDIVPYGASNLIGTSWDQKLPENTRKVGMVFQGDCCGPYPHKDEWPKLTEYGITVADIAEHKVKDRFLKG